MTGRERVLKKIRVTAIGFIVIGILFTLLGLLFVVAAIATDDGTRSNVGMGIAFGIVMALGILLVIFPGIRNLRHPEKTSVFKNNPQILEMADELYAGIIYQDKFLLLSPRIIGSAVDPRELSFTDEVFLAYVYTHRTNGIPDQKLLKLETARGTMGFNIYGKKDPEVDGLCSLIAQNCRYVRFGYTKEGLDYVEQMRNAWKADQAQKQGRL